MLSIRNAMLATAFAVTAAAALTGATFGGVTKEANRDEACTRITWPYMPAYCLDGATDRPIRIVSLDRPEASGFAARFLVAFE